MVGRRQYFSHTLRTTPAEPAFIGSVFQFQRCLLFRSKAYIKNKLREQLSSSVHKFQQRWNGGRVFTRAQPLQLVCWHASREPFLIFESFVVREFITIIICRFALLSQFGFILFAWQAFDDGVTMAASTRFVLHSAFVFFFSTLAFAQSTHVRLKI